MYRSDKRLYTTADGSRIVPEDSVDAAVLLVAEGGEIPDELAEKYGLTGEKASKQTANKAAPKAEDK